MQWLLEAAVAMGKGSGPWSEQKTGNFKSWKHLIFSTSLCNSAIIMPLLQMGKLRQIKSYSPCRKRGAEEGQTKSTAGQKFHLTLLMDLSPQGKGQFCSEAFSEMCSGWVEGPQSFIHNPRIQKSFHLMHLAVKPELA